MCGIFDGHGSLGHMAAEICKSILPHKVFAFMQTGTVISACIHQAFEETHALLVRLGTEEQKLCMKVSQRGQPGLKGKGASVLTGGASVAAVKDRLYVDYGTTGVLCVWHGQSLYVASTGDSGCVVLSSNSGAQGDTVVLPPPAALASLLHRSARPLAKNPRANKPSSSKTNKGNGGGLISKPMSTLSLPRQTLQTSFDAKRATSPLKKCDSNQSLCSSKASETIEISSSDCEETVCEEGSGIEKDEEGGASSQQLGHGDDESEPSSDDEAESVESRLEAVQVVKAKDWTVRHMTLQHNPSVSKAEERRLRAAGAQLFDTGNELRVFPGNMTFSQARQHNLTLNMSRALGHAVLAKWGVIASPTITCLTLLPGQM